MSFIKKHCWAKLESLGENNNITVVNILYTRYVYITLLLRMKHYGEYSY